MPPETNSTLIFNMNVNFREKRKSARLSANNILIKMSYCETK